MTGGWGTKRREPPTDSEVQLVTCPACQAVPGMPCTQPDDRSRHAVRTFHWSRIDRAMYPKENDGNE
jgi:hypothetical protein